MALIYIFICVIVVWLLLEEAIYYYFNQYVFGKAEKEKNWMLLYKQVRNKMKKNAS